MRKKHLHRRSCRGIRQVGSLFAEDEGASERRTNDLPRSDADDVDDYVVVDGDVVDEGVVDESGEDGYDRPFVLGLYDFVL